MVHHIYQTKGVVLGSVSTGESNRFYKIYTEELGLIGATAQSVREAKSKLRYSLQHYSFVNLNLVYGRSGWKIINASEGDVFSVLKKDGFPQKIFAHLCSLIIRLVHGETQDKIIFEIIVSLASYLNTHEVSERVAPFVVALAVLRLLARLGYIDPAPYELFVKEVEFSDELIVSFEKFHNKATRDIAHAIQSSHL